MFFDDGNHSKLNCNLFDEFICKDFLGLQTILDKQSIGLFPEQLLHVNFFISKFTFLYRILIQKNTPTRWVIWRALSQSTVTTGDVFAPWFWVLTGDHVQISLGLSMQLQKNDTALAVTLTRRCLFLWSETSPGYCTCRRSLCWQSVQHREFPRECYAYISFQALNTLINIFSRMKRPNTITIVHCLWKSGIN